MDYHHKTFALLGETPVVSRAALRALDAAEARLGRVLPAAVREWYAQAGAVDRLDRYSNDDPPVAIAEFAVTERRLEGPVGETRELLVFRRENQGLCVWAVLLDGSDDPPVVVDGDARFRDWIACGVTFAEHLYAWMWDFRHVLQRESLVQGRTDPLAPADLAWLRARFSAGPATLGWPGRTQYRFSRDGQWILIWANDDAADWFLAADTQEGLGALLATVRELGSVGEALVAQAAELEAPGLDE
jgi:hypothetical protein